MIVNVPVTSENVKSFLEGWESSYLNALSIVRKKLDEDRETSESLSAVYAIHSRGSLQGGSEIKAPHKIRLKANAFAAAQKKTRYDFLETPDIVGLTISVLFPSDIQSVVRHIDRLIQKDWLPAYGDRKKTVKPQKGPRSGQVRAETIYGAIHEDEAEGYYACHFYVRLEAGEPIVEIQVKTVLHDAWGRKTHDLSYKNQVRIAKLVKDQFASLGQMIARVDLQSDFLKTQIEFDNAAVERKKRLLQIQSMHHDVVRNGVLDDDMKALLGKIKNLEAVEPAEIPRKRWKEIYDGACKLFSKNYSNSCQLLALLGAITNNAGVKSEAIKRIVKWETHLHDTDDIIKPKLFHHLAHYTFGDTPAAIDAADIAVKYVQGMIDSGVGDVSVSRRRLNSLHNCLAYYHAEIIGTEQGDKRDSFAETAKNMEVCVADLVARGIIDNKDRIFKFDLANVETFPVEAYPSLDTSLFIKIKLATAPAQVQEALAVMAALTEKSPPEYAEISAKSLNLHQHHAYHKLLELEAIDAATKLR